MPPYFAIRRQPDEQWVILAPDMAAMCAGRIVTMTMPAVGMPGSLPDFLFAAFLGPLPDVQSPALLLRTLGNSA